MTKSNRAVAVIPREYFRWRAGVQFIKSFPKRTDAVRYARYHGHNLVVECDDGNGMQFDVLQDTGLAGKAAVSLKLVEASNAVM